MARRVKTVDDLDARKSSGAAPTDEGWWSSLLSQGEDADLGSPGKEGSNPAETIDGEVDWNLIQQDMERERVFNCEVVGYNHGGLLVANRDLHGFVPLSHLVRNEGSINTHALPDYLGRNLRLRVIECDQNRNRVVLSERAAQSIAGVREKVLTEVETNQRVRGEVTHITKFGLFVDIGGVEGLVHKSELSWARVTHPNQSADIGEKVEALVLHVDRERGRVALSLKRLEPNPWQRVAQQYDVGDVQMVKVTELVRYGAFAQLDAGIEGLIHASKMPLRDRQRPWDVFDRGQQLKVRILSIDVEKQRISLGLVSSSNSPTGSNQ